MTRPILVTGGTGTLGRVLVQQLLDNGLRPRVLSRRERNSTDPAGAQWVTADLLDGARLADAVGGARAIVHCATNGRQPADDVHGTRRLIEAALRGGSPQLIYVSIVGVDEIPRKYYRYKHGVEGIVQRSGLPWTILRATQFHDLIHGVLRAACRLPVLPLPSGTSFQPIDTRDVARRLADLAVGPAQGRVPDIGGPLVETIQELGRQYLTAAGRRRLVGSVWLPGAVARGYRRGYQLTSDNRYGTATFEQHLARTIKREVG